MTRDIGIWVAAIGTLVTYTFLWKTNRAYRLAEHVLLGTSVGNTLVLGYNNVKNSAWDPIFKKGQWILIVPVILGILM